MLTLLAVQMGCSLRCMMNHASARQYVVLRNFLCCQNGHGWDSDRQLHRSLERNMEKKFRNGERGHVKVLKGVTQRSVGSESTRVPEKGYIEIRKKARRREQLHTPKTLSDMQEDIEKLAKTLYKLRVNEKGEQEKLREVAPAVVFEEELRLAPYVNGPVEHMTFTVRTPDRRLLLKQFTGITASRTILEMLRERKVRINEVVIYDFAIVCKPMDTLDIWKGELEQNPAFARVDRYQLLHIVPSSCYQYYIVHAVALKDFVIENWFPFEVSENREGGK